jgi:hypothetical protein
MDPDIHYARNGDVAIAFQVIGDGDRDLVFVPDFVSNLVYAWDFRTGASSTSGSPVRFA